MLSVWCQLPTWFSHRYHDLSLMSVPPPLRVVDYQAVLAQFDSIPLPAASASSASASNSGADERTRKLETIFAMSCRSFQRAKELLQSIAEDQRMSAQEESMHAAAM